MSRATILASIAGFALVVVLVAPFVGSNEIPLRTLWSALWSDSGDFDKADIFWKIFWMIRIRGSRYRPDDRSRAP